MNPRRLALYLALLVVLGLIGFGLALWGLFGCAPPPLPGDELWTWRRNLGEALGLLVRLGSQSCFTADPGGALALWLGSRTVAILAAILALIVLWESVGRELRLAWFRARGGHLVLAGTADDLAGLARQHGRFAGTVFLAPDRGAAVDIARHRPFAEIAMIDAKRLPLQLARFGANKATLLAATTPSDLANVALAEAGLATPGSGELLVRLEQHSVRSFSSHRLRIRAADRGRPLAIVSLTQLQTRRGLAAAMAGRYTLDGAPRVHIALCGSGRGLEAASFEIARQGFGLDTEKPLLSILRTGAGDFAPGAVHRLESSGVAEIEMADVLAASADGLDRAIAAAVEDHPPLRAVHCMGETAGEAEALAQRWEEVLLALGQPVPPIVAYAAEDRPLGSTGMIRVATAHDLAEAREAARLMDQRARAVHQLFLDAQRLARGDKFGSAPAEVDWERLPESFQNDNRNVADQMDFKLATIFMLARPGAGSVAPTPDDAEQLAELAHARWWAAKALSGWRFGPVRDDKKMLHPDMLPYDQLSEPVRQKDRDEVASLAAMAGLAGEALLRERRIGLPRPLGTAALTRFVDDLRATPKPFVPVAVLSLDDAAMVRLAQALIGAGIAIEAVLGRSTGDLRGDPGVAPELASVLRRAWRIHVAGDDDARPALAERATACANENGAIDALV
ncbi:MAG: hypothetical protein HY834_16025 [Devosia nanyangense]|uniref:Ryanodine receptor Ryr domain-containing protein n=1 Tax=Devosia nanyangense TaxID=1228055 RepID=A0A933L569_9HYPH|nr:hypothetical protein [Devosia nanyangense]